MGELSGNDMPKGKGEGRITAQNVTNFKVNLCLSEAGSVVFSVSPSVEIPPIYEQPIPLVEYSGEFFPCVQTEFLLQLIATSTVLLLYASKHGTLFSVTPYEVDSQEILPQPYLQGLNKSPPLSPSSCSTFTTLVIFCWSLPNFLLSSFTKRTRLDVANSPNAVSCIHSSNQRGSKNRPLQGKQLLWIKNLTRLSSLKTPLLQLMCSYTTPYSWLPSEHTNEKKTEPLFSVGTIWNTGNSI